MQFPPYVVPRPRVLSPTSVGRRRQLRGRRDARRVPARGLARRARARSARSPSSRSSALRTSQSTLHARAAETFFRRLSRRRRHCIRAYARAQCDDLERPRRQRCGTIRSPLCGRRARGMGGAVREFGAHAREAYVLFNTNGRSPAPDKQADSSSRMPPRGKRASGSRRDRRTPRCCADCSVHARRSGERTGSRYCRCR